MDRKCKKFLIFAISVIHICFGAASVNNKITAPGNDRKYRRIKNRELPVKRTWRPVSNSGTLKDPRKYYGTNLINSPNNYILKNTKKSDLPEKGQLRFMKTLLGRVKTLLNDSKSKKENDSEKSKAKQTEEKVSSVTSNNGKLYGVIGDSEEDMDKERERSVNVISIPLNALGKFSKNERLGAVTDTDEETPLDFFNTRQTNAQVLLRPLPVRSNDGEDREEIPGRNGFGSLLPVVLGDPGEDDRGRVAMIMNPGTRSLRPVSDITSSQLVPAPNDPRKIPFMLERYRDIMKHNKADDSLYRDIGHIPGESRFVDHSSQVDAGITSQRHRRPGRYHHTMPYPNDDEDDSEDDGYYNDDDEDEEEDDDSDFDDVSDRTDARLNAEEREIAAKRKMLLSMLPGNDPMYASENRGLRLMQPAPQMQIPDAFLGNPMLGGLGFNQRNILPLNGAAMAGEHADNANGRDVFMVGNQGERQVFRDSSLNMDYSQMQTPSVRVDDGGFTLGGSHAQAMSPNEVSYILQRQALSNGFNELTQKDKILHPKGVHSGTSPGNILLQVNGKPIGDSKQLRNRVVNGKIFKGKEKIIKSKGPVDVKISRATDGVHSKVVDITSPENMKVLEAKSKIMIGN